jgi:hypothetical protein
VKTDKNMQILHLVLAGVGIALLIFASYFFFGRFLPVPSTENADWGAFGSYFGGIAGPVFTFFSALLIAATIRQQRQEMIKQDMLRYIMKIDEDISHLLTRGIHVGNNRYVELGDMVSGIESPAGFHEQSYRAALERLMRLTALYCEAIALYRANVDGYFIFKAYQQRARELVAYLEQRTNYLNPMAGPALGFCKLHLEGSADA